MAEKAPWRESEVGEGRIVAHSFKRNRKESKGM